MKKLSIIATLLVIAAYFIFVHGSTFKKDFNFNGETYSHIKKMYGGEITNHFYTKNGEDFNTAKDFVQIIEISDKIQKSDWSTSFRRLYNQYRLSPVQDDEFELSGNFRKAGLFFNSYAAPINVKGKEHMAFYIFVTDEDQNEESTSQKVNMINKLKSIQFD